MDAEQLPPLSMKYRSGCGAGSGQQDPFSCGERLSHDQLEPTTNQALNWARERRKMTAEQTPPRFRLMTEFDPKQSSRRKGREWVGGYRAEARRLGGGGFVRAA
jgi:hypothetical protein